VNSLHYLSAFVFGYLLGSIPFGLIVTRLAGTKDIRTLGSGNIGATNVLRTGSKGLAAVTLLGDMLKGTVAVLIATWWDGRDFAIAAGLGAVLGHIFPVWVGFKGGKGVATYIGVLIGFSWPVAAAFGVIWGVVAYFTRYSSLSGLVACAATPPLLWLCGHGQTALLFVVLTVLVWIMHRGNIARLTAGTEPKIGRSTGRPAANPPPA
jgi:acyl phosphate:glycerol-3-phosphate acyltransferase